MASDGLARLIPLAVRLHLDSTSYTNALPSWIDPITLNYRGVEESVARRLQALKMGDRPRQPTFTVWVPAKNGTGRRWLLPSVNDMIVLQVCASALAEGLEQERVPDPDRVFSYRLNKDPDKLALTASQIVSWLEFQNETQERLKRSSHLLQVDLKRAFSSIDRGMFFSFLKQRSPESETLIQALLDEAAAPEPGLPMINDSMSFLGNAYLSHVDKIFRRYTDDFIRFVDDYRVFGSSRSVLEAVLENVSRDLRPLGFRINPRKLRLGTGQEYLDAVSELKFAKTRTEDNNYISAVIFNDVIEPEQMVKLIEKVLFKPDEHLNEGVGRFLLGALRRMRVNSLAAREKGYYSPRERFVEKLSETQLPARAFDLFQTYAPRKNMEWRSIWLLYLMEDISLWDFREPLAKTVESPELPEVVKLWLKRTLASADRPLPSETDVFQRSYLEAGKLCYGTEAS